MNSTGPALQLKGNTVGITIKVDKCIEIEEIKPVSARIIVANVLLSGCSLQVICCYATGEEDSNLSRNIFYNLNKQFECENTRKKYLYGRLQWLLICLVKKTE